MESESKSESKIAFFGCWGDNDNQTPQCNPVTRHIKKSEYSEIIIAGDNYYVEKITSLDSDGNEVKIKNFKAEAVKNIFDCLPNDKPIYMLTGNHEYDVLKKSKTTFDDGREFDECAVLTEEFNQVLLHHPAIQIHFDTIRQHNHMIKDGVLFLFID